MRHPGWRHTAVLLAACCAVLCGCAARNETGVPTPHEQDPAPLLKVVPRCLAVEGSVDSSWYSREPGETWTEGGSHFLVCRSEPEWPVTDAEGGREGRDAAEDEALQEAYAFAFERLAARDVSFEGWQVEAMVEDRVRSHARGESVDFPRIRIAARVIETCERPPSDGEAWRASLLVEYPIAYLRGDVNNARWHARRVGNEAHVLVASAKDLFAAGRWFDALLELKRARALFRTVASRPDLERSIGTVDSLMRWAAAALSVDAVDGVQVVEVGERRDVELAFGWSYEWEGENVGAVRLPVSFRPHGFGAVFASDAETDDTGAAVCRIVAAYGDAGEHAIEARLDHGVLVEALGPVYAGSIEPYEGPLHPVFLVEGAHALSVCVEMKGLDAGDETHVMAGFERRMERDGFRLEGCSPEVDVVIRADGGKRSSGAEERWTARVALSASAFDQRTASDIGRPSIHVEESSTEGPREAEVLALREAGRLLAAYLSNRILASGS
ncbi:MAG: hypothetical protein ABIG03_04245 [Candidatus Eisenbacteria bacterium]